MSLADDSTREIMRTERIDLKMTSGKVLALQGVLHVPTLRRNLISESSLLRAGYKIVKESNKFVISKSNIFIGKGFICDGLFRLNVINSPDNKISIPIALNIESCDIWHGRLGHVNFNSIKKMINLNLIPNLLLTHLLNVKYVFKVHVRTPFHSITRNYEPLELIHNDVCDSNRVLTRGVEDTL